MLRTKLIAALLCLSVLPARAEAPVEVLGEPFAAHYAAKTYARNIWVMRLVGDRLYLGAGNSSNKPPAANAGPVPLVAYDIKDNRFVTEAKLTEEQVDRIVPVGDGVCIPGHDPTESWEFGNLYCRGKDGWTKLRNQPNVIHTYDLLEQGGALIAAGSTRDGAAILVSRDRGHSWTSQAMGGARFYSLLKVAGRVYAIKTTASPQRRARDPEGSFMVAALDAGLIASPRPELREAELFPDTGFPGYRTRKVIRPLSVGDEAYYIGAETHNDHQAKPFGLYRAASLEPPRTSRVALPPGELPYDLALHDGSLYILTNMPMGDGFKVAVHAMAPGQKPVERLAFKAPTFARSFAVAGDAFYFGLGCETDLQQDDAPLAAECGRLLRVRR